MLLLKQNAKLSVAVLFAILACAGCTTQGSAQPQTGTAAPNCREWNTYAFFEQAIHADVTRCLKGGADPNARTASGKTPLHLANDGAVARILIEAGANVNARDDGRDTPLHDTSSAVVTEALLDAGADPNARNQHNRVPMHDLPGSADRVQLLLDAGADPNARSQKGHAPLHLAVRNVFPRSVAALVKAGADVNARDNLGATPLEWALRAHQRLLQKPGDAMVELNRGALQDRLRNADEIISALKNAGANSHVN